MRSRCEHCGKFFAHAATRPRIYCSRECRDGQKSEIRQCPTCKKDFKTYINPPNRRTYCCKKCVPVTTKIPKTCAGCGKEFEVWPSMNAQQYCTIECRQNHKCTVTQCPNCGKDVRSWKSNKHIYCNRECEKAYTVLTTRCPKCDKEFTYHRSWPRIYCSRECSNSVNAVANLGDYCATGSEHPFWEGGSVGYRGPNWIQQKNRVRKRDGYKCQHCGLTEKKLGHKMHVHHITPFRTYGYIPDVNDHYKIANKMNNLVSLCPSCHKKAEHGTISYQLPLL